MTDVSVAELPAKLAEVLDEVRRGGTVAVMDGMKVVARFVPGEEGTRRADLRPLGEIELPPLTFKPQFDGVEELLKDRGRR